MPPGTEQITQQWGAFGAVFLLILVPLAVFTRGLYERLNQVQQSRVDDARAVTATVVESTKEFSQALRETGATRQVDEQIMEILVDLREKVISLESKVSAMDARFEMISRGDRSPPGRPR